MNLHLASQPLPVRIGSYRVQGVLGRGGMGVVYRGLHEANAEAVAIKKVVAANAAEIAGLRREIDALRRLDHPGVVRIVDQGMVHGEPWYAMELLEGATLAEYNSELWHGASLGDTEVAVTRTLGRKARDRSLPGESGTRPAPAPEVSSRAPVACGQLPFALSVVRHLCSTLSYVHGEGIVHRDIKSDNIVLCGGVPKLLDFGLVRRFPGGTGREVLDADAGQAGTAGYMPPEQVRGEMVDARADLYAIGCVLYELLTGRLPYAGHSAVEVRQHHLETAPWPPSRWVEDVPEALDELVLTLLQKDPERRFGHAGEVADRLARLGAVAPEQRSTRPQRSYVYRSRLVGREQPQQTLRAHVASALGGQGSLVAISGDSGIGKTYLAMSAASEATLGGMRVIIGNSAPVGAAARHASDAPLHPFRGLLLAVADRCLAAPELTQTLLGEHAKVLAACEPSLATLPGVEGLPDPEPLSARATRTRLLDALGQTVEAFAAASPLVLLLDDLQWADELSLSFLASRPPDWFRRRRLLVVTIHRADEETPAIREILGQPYTRILVLARLGEDSVHEIVRGMLAMERPPDPLLSLLARQSAGNPFFVAEYLRTAVAEQLLYRGIGGGWCVDKRLMTPDSADRVLALPGAIVSLITRRLQGLSTQAQHLLGAAAVLGSDVPRELLLAVAGLSEEQAWAPGRELTARQVLEEASLGRLRFIHDRLRETAYRNTPEALRTRLHRRAARVLTRKFEGSADLPLTYASLAHHHRRGGQPREALAYLELAGEHALSTYSNRDAIAYLSEAVELDAALRRAQPGPASKERPGKTRRQAAAEAAGRTRRERQLAEAHYALGDLAAVDSHLAHALDASGQRLPTSPLGWAGSVLRDAAGQLRRQSGGAAAAGLESSQRELHEESALVMHHLAERHYYSFDALPMIGASLRSVSLAEQAGVTGRIAKPYAMLGMAAGISGLSRLGARYFDRAREAAGATHDDTGMAYALYSEAAWRIGDGEWDRVRDLSAEGVRVAQRAGDTKALGMSNTLLGHVAFYTGSFAESARIYRELEISARRTGDAQHLSWSLYAGARARMCLGELESAHRMLLESNRLLEELVEVPSKIIAPGLLASLLLKQGQLDEALDAAELTASRIRQNLPTVFATVAGYAAVAEVYLADWRRQRAARRAGATARAAARASRALVDLLALAVNIPLGRPTFHRMAAQWCEIAGRRQRAQEFWRRSLQAASRLAMPYDAALVRVELSHLLAPGVAERGRLLEQAERELRRMGCRLDLERLQRVRSARTA